MEFINTIRPTRLIELFKILSDLHVLWPGYGLVTEACIIDNGTD